MNFVTSWMKADAAWPRTSGDTTYSFIVVVLFFAGLAGCILWGAIASYLHRRRRS